jgi:catechol-2,3-dioxygenase
MPEFTGISHVELAVRDADRSAAWYERVLGMQRLVDEATASERVINLIHPTARLALGLRQYESGDDAEFSEFRVGLHHLALNVKTREELESWVEHLGSCGIAHSTVSDMPYGSVLIFRDPDNIQLELFVYSNLYG